MSSSIQELTTLALDLLPQAVLIADRAGAILLRNAAADEMLPEGKDISQILRSGPAGALDWQADLDALAEGPGRLSHRDVSLAGRDNRRHTVDISLHRFNDGRLDGVLVVVADVSERVTMERRLAAGERLAGAGEVAAKVAHELNNPLDGVLRFIGLAERAGDAGAAEYLQRAREGLMRMSEIIRSLREAGGLRSAGGQKGPVERLLDEAVGVMQPRAQALGVAIVSDVQQDACLAVEVEVFQVFCNVIKNALDAMPGGGMLNVRLRGGPGCVVVEFADTGCGLAAGQAEEIFQPFYTTKAPGEGSGLGLTICREILARSGGTIAAASRPGGGAVVTIQLPVPRKPPDTQRL